MHYISVERHGFGEGPIQRWDPRLKVIGLLLALIVVGHASLDATRTGWMSVAALTVAVGALQAFGSLPMKGLFLRSLIVLPFVGFLAFSQMFVMLPDATGALFSLPGEQAIFLRDGGGERALLLLARAWVSVWATITVVATTPFPRLLGVLSWARAPRVFIQILAVLYRTLWVLGDECANMLLSMKLRNFGRRTPLLRRGATGIMAHLFARTWERTRTLVVAMKLRGDRGQFLLFDRPSWQGADTLRLVLWIVFLGGVVTAPHLVGSGPS